MLLQCLNVSRIKDNVEAMRLFTRSAYKDVPPAPHSEFANKLMWSSDVYTTTSKNGGELTEDTHTLTLKIVIHVSVPARSALQYELKKPPTAHELSSIKPVDQ